jgi:hypothetical protein
MDARSLSPPDRPNVGSLDWPLAPTIRDYARQWRRIDAYRAQHPRTVAVTTDWLLTGRIPEQEA